MASEKGSRKDKNQNIQVFVRLRPLNQRERDIKSIGVVEVANNREIIIRQSPSSAHTKKFTFDRAFGPNAKQVEVYHEVVSPLIEEVLAGYNCTVFAYGQTGTGKTHTMVGENTSSEDSTWQNDPLAGIIPRALSQLFDELRITNTEYTVRVSYLELYNEELFDLLATSDDNSKLRIYEDVTRKGSNIVNGLEEITVYNKREVYKIMAQGQDRKRVASTQMNAQSSNNPNGKSINRSHTVFTIVVHMKENSPEGEELVKIGKLNLVDLAGSENISKAGSDNPGKRERARECVNINQSLLTLGRVITALVERHPHIPYRESKLTRILQESLGGRTKTSIIATISPGHKDMEETMSTLDYAHRAKNIQNKPEVNQKLTKRAILKEYAEEIDRLKRDLQAARDKNGVYLTEDTYAELTLKQQEQRKEIQELLLKKKAMEDEKERIESVFKEMELKLLERQRELQTTKEKLDNTKEKLAGTRTELNSTKRECVEANHLVQVRARTEQQLLQQAAAIMSAADVAVTHVHALHDNLQTRRVLESENLQTLAQFRDQTGDCRRGVKDKLKTFVDTAGNTCDKIKGGIVDYTKTTSESQQQNANKLQQLIQKMKQVTDEIKSQTTSTESSIRTSSQSQMSSIKAAVCAHEQAMHKIADISRGIAGLVARAVKDVDVLRALDHMLQQWYTTSQDRITSLQRSLGSLGEHARSRERSRTLAAEKRREKRNACIEQREGSLKQACEEFQRHKAELSQRLSQQLDELQSERDSTTLRLRTWLAESIQREQAMMNERIQQHERHAEMERNLLEERLSRRRQEIEEEKKQSEERINKQLERHELLLQESRADLDLYSEELQNWSQHELEATQCIDDITQQVEHGCSAISTDMELFSRNLTELVTLLIGKMEAVMEQSRLDVEREVTEMVSNDEQQAQELTSTIQNNMESFLQQNKQVMDSLVHQVESNSTATTTDLNQLISATTSEINSLNLHTFSQLTCVDKLETSVRELDTAVCEDMCRQQSLEEGYYKDIKIYTPSGNTPDKTEYRYPRSLAATSPHERILNRFRANYRQNCDEDCMIVESDMSQTDSESSVSEDSSLFTAPSPLDSKPIMKSTSESDIYSRGKEQTQENPDRFIAFKRPSKLPAPLSVKKPLVERNDN